MTPVAAARLCADAASADPHFAACVLAIYREVRGLSREGLAAELGLTPTGLDAVRLCPAPRTAADVRRIAGRWGADPAALARACAVDL